MNGYEKMREAITKAEAVIDVARMMVHGQEYDLDLLDFDGALQMLRNALTLPRRNCDVGTAYEQGNRMRQFCAKQKRNGIINCGYCPIKHQYQRDCTLAWAQMPYAEEGGAAQ